MPLNNTAIAAASYYTVALKSNGSVVVWGFPADVPLAAQSHVTKIAAANFYFMTLLGTAVALEAKLDRHELIVSWPTNANGFRLQSTRSLIPPVIWTDLAAIPAVVGPRFTLTNSELKDVGFYQLRRP